MAKKHHVEATIYDKRGRILAHATNSYTKTHPYQARLAHASGQPAKQYLHAEVAAICRCRVLRHAVKIVIVRYGAFGEPRNARPCEICQLAIREAGIQEVEHT